ncbi:Proline-rich nuclear receptor coactivator motif [Sesbania bispinosa]|nr:Proline-rich nuclear receptor coactivator motif [Sesbania bispinosa]
METLVVVQQHRNRYYRSKSQDHARFGSSSPSRGFRGINCRTFQTGSGILPTPLKSYTSPLTKGPSSKTPLTTPNSDNKTCSKTVPISTPIPINAKACRKEGTFSECVPDGNLLLSELWAGPTYSNSPPPSSLPIPKFSVRPKRTVSLELPSSCPKIELHPVANSAPCTPRGEHSPSARDLFVNADSATKTLCCILNLNLDDE